MHEPADVAERDRVRRPVAPGEVEGIRLAGRPADRVEQPEDQAEDEQRGQAELTGRGQDGGDPDRHHPEEVDQDERRRRSNRSTRPPAGMPRTSDGTNRAANVAPTARAESDTSSASQPIATIPTAMPNADAEPPSQSAG